MRLETIKCPQCGMYHPIIPLGEMCPLVRDKNDNEIEFLDVITNFSNILKDNKDKIKDVNKFKTYIQSKLLEIISNYHE